MIFLTSGKTNRIQKIFITNDDRYLISFGEEEEVIIFNIQSKKKEESFKNIKDYNDWVKKI